MNEEERERFNKLAARTHVLELMVVELCRRTFNGDEIDRFTAPLDPGVASGDPDTAKALNEALRGFRREIMLPIMGC